ncbi:MAG TPA: hypothetical protein V6D22_24355 [Candidatus Obscuribacterales bacterium]
MPTRKRATSLVGSTGVVVAARIAENLCATGEVCTGGGGWQPSPTTRP